MIIAMEASSSCSSPLSVLSISTHANRLSRASISLPHLHLSSLATITSTSTFRQSIKVLSSRRKQLPILKISAAFERFTERSIKAVMLSQKEAKALGKDMVFNQHLLLGLIAESRGSDGFLGSGIEAEVAREVVASIWSEEGVERVGIDEVGSATDVPFSISTKRVFEAAVEYSRKMGYNFVAPEHIAIGLFTVDDGSAGRVLKRLGANVDRLAAVAVIRLQGELAKDGREPPVTPKRTPEKLSPQKSTVIRSSEKEKDKSALAQFCVDLTARASEGLIDPVIGRDAEVDRMIQILCRRTKNNPILLGEAGVGKTAIAEGLAISISQGNAPVLLLSKRVMSLDIGLLIAGAKERGELEGRVTTLIKDVKKSGDVILFIDEVHTLIGSGTVGRGNKGSGLDIGNLLKPALGRGELQCIASTTMDEYRTHFEKDKALARRFQPVLVNEPSQEDAFRILLGLRERYETHHKCKYTLEALNAAVHLSARYIPDRHLPDKAIDLIDEAGSRARMDSFRKKKAQQTGILLKSPDDYWQEIRAVQAMHEVQALESKLTKDDGASDTEEDSTLPASSNYDEITVVGPDEIAAVASLWSGIPVQQLTADERKLLVGLDELLKERVVGQDEAVIAISRAVKRSRAGLSDPNRPIATMLFCGPTGVGKTELTKALAASYFGSETAMLRLDMSEYMERHTVSKLIGSPPGYVGYGEGGTLTEAIRKRPHATMKTRSKSRSEKPTVAVTSAHVTPENFAFAATRIAVAQTIHATGYNSAQTSALNTLASAAAKYIETLAGAAAASAVFGGRTQSNLHDVVVGLETMAATQGFAGASDLNRLVLSSSILVELSRFVKYSLEIPFAQTIRREMPLPKTVVDEQSGLGYGHIPRWLPAIPLIERDVSRGKERRELYGCLASEEKFGVNEEEINGIGVDSVRDEKTRIGLRKKRGRVRFTIGAKEKGLSMGLRNGVCKLGKRVSCENQLDNEGDNGNRKRRRKKKMMEWIDTLE